MKYVLAVTLFLGCGASSTAGAAQPQKEVRAQDPMAIVGQPQTEVRPPISSVKRKADQHRQEKAQTEARPKPKKVEIDVEARKRPDQ